MFNILRISLFKVSTANNFLEVGRGIVCNKITSIKQVGKIIFVAVPQC